jgi:hypothetical protein
MIALGACTDDGGEAAPTTASPSTAVPTTPTSEQPVDALAMFWLLEGGSLDAPVLPETTTEFDVLYEWGACVFGDESVPVSELARVDVDESADHVKVTVWQRPSDDPRLPPDNQDCLRVAVGIPAHVKLAAPMGTRRLVDGFCSVEASMAVDVGSPLKDDVCDRYATSAR